MTKHKQMKAHWRFSHAREHFKVFKGYWYTFERLGSSTADNTTRAWKKVI